MKHSWQYVKSQELHGLLEAAKQKLYEAAMVARSLHRIKSLPKINSAIGEISKVQRKEV